MERNIEPELLDELPGEDPRARRSRRDLRRINGWMGHVAFTARMCARGIGRSPPRRIVDLGAGDGDFLLRWTRRIPALPAGTEIVLVDRGRVLGEDVLATLRGRGFVAHFEQADVMDWLRSAPVRQGTWMVANLFLHHFDDGRLREMLDAVAAKADWFCACEPRRAGWPLAASRWLWLVGASPVTRHDAVVSVRAGFCGSELSALWPGDNGWRLREGGAGLFSHVFEAERTGIGSGNGP